VDIGRRSEVRQRVLATTRYGPRVFRIIRVRNTVAVSFLVMDFLDGQTLADRLRKGPLPLSPRLEYGAQIAAAPSAAHRPEITYRVLKPATGCEIIPGTA